MIARKGFHVPQLTAVDSITKGKYMPPAHTVEKRQGTSAPAITADVGKRQGTNAPAITAENAKQMIARKGFHMPQLTAVDSITKGKYMPPAHTVEKGKARMPQLLLLKLRNK
jgi:hypothetical protein